MKPIELNFKKEDFESDYLISNSCAITTALRRAGIEAIDYGVEIQDEFSNAISEKDSYDKMTRIVFSMYLHGSPDMNFSDKTLVPTEPKDFSITILLDI